MQAYEFYAKPVNGMIVIPEHYKNLIKDDVRVIILDKKPLTLNRDIASTHKKTDLLSPPCLKTKGWKFNRGEANERLCQEI